LGRTAAPNSNPVQEWGEEVEDGAVYGVTLRREPVTPASDPSEAGPCCAFVQYRTCKVRRLKAATLDLLVTQLLDPGCQEQDYGRIFLSTYRTFTSTSALIELKTCLPPFGPPLHSSMPSPTRSSCPCSASLQTPTPRSGSESPRSVTKCPNTGLRSSSDPGFTGDKTGLH
uniref:N-terminal Ras-GEF domain-containing protein n=1 Tax=Monopterus albus TaxID=43700 RepID=A0A3Q3Q1G8_MONAL